MRKGRCFKGGIKNKEVIVQYNQDRLLLNRSNDTPVIPDTPVCLFPIDYQGGNEFINMNQINNIILQ
jgi:hypothetical protein